jgi:hypothetical protein
VWRDQFRLALKHSIQGDLRNRLSGGRDAELFGEVLADPPSRCG